MIGYDWYLRRLCWFSCKIDRSHCTSLWKGRVDQKSRKRVYIQHSFFFDYSGVSALSCRLGWLSMQNYFFEVCDRRIPFDPWGLCGCLDEEFCQSAAKMDYHYLSFGISLILYIVAWAIPGTRKQHICMTSEQKIFSLSPKWTESSTILESSPEEKGKYGLGKMTSQSAVSDLVETETHQKQATCRPTYCKWACQTMILCSHMHKNLVREIVQTHQTDKKQIKSATQASNHLQSVVYF